MDYGKSRPITSKPITYRASSSNKIRPLTSLKNEAYKINNNKFNSKNEKDKNNLKYLKQESKPITYRSIRPASSIQDKIFNKYWDENIKQKDNINDINNNYSNNLKTERIKSYQTLVTTKEANIDNQFFNRKLYKFQKIDWDSKKTTNFLTCVGGLETDQNAIYLNQKNSNISLNSTMITNTQQLTSRPNSALEENFNSNKLRPFTSKNINNCNTFRNVNSAKPVK